MKQKPIKHRIIALTTNGQRAYLDYLKNLTPLSLLILFSVSTYEKAHSDPETAGVGIFLSVTFFIIFILAFAANITLLYKSGFHLHKRFSRRVWREQFNKGKNSLCTAYAIWKRKYVEIIEFMAALLFLQATVAMAVGYGLMLASKF